jgi:hypothetical protein
LQIPRTVKIPIVHLRDALSGHTDERGTTVTNARQHDALSAPGLLDQRATPVESHARRTLDVRA